ncbi:MAG: GntR family transcriptional regulator [Microbacteriaceae bacterium]
MRATGQSSAYQTLRAQIIAGELAPGSRITEDELASSLGLSRTPVREALRQLKAEALVQQLANGNTIVTEINKESAAQIGLLRSRIEGALVREACGRLSAENLSELERLVTLSFRLFDDDGEVMRLGKDFHQIIHRASGNIWGQTMLHQINGHVDRLRSLSTVQRGRGMAASREHEAIYLALKAEDADTAERLMQEHIVQGSNLASSAIA